tara:strand:- start:286 stop:600 length:315 start_codon:yes stop_codon:yes gene_type:complete
VSQAVQKSSSRIRNLFLIFMSGIFQQQCDAVPSAALIFVAGILAALNQATWLAVALVLIHVILTSRFCETFNFFTTDSGWAELLFQKKVSTVPIARCFEDVCKS